MPRMRFSKTGDAVWISHLDLMRALQRSFRRAGIDLKHSQGFSPHPMLSLALPLSVGVASEYEIADFTTEGPLDCSQVPARMNMALPKGIFVLACYENGQAIKHLKWLEAALTLEYDNGVPADAVSRIEALFRRDALPVEKHGKNGPVEVDIIPMLHDFVLCQPDETTLQLTATVSAQNPTLNPLLLVTAIETHLADLKPDFSKCRRLRLLNESMRPFQ